MMTVNNRLLLADSSMDLC